MLVIKLAVFVMKGGVVSQRYSRGDFDRESKTGAAAANSSETRCETPCRWYVQHYSLVQGSGRKSVQTLFRRSLDGFSTLGVETL